MGYMWKGGLPGDKSVEGVENRCVGRGDGRESGAGAATQRYHEAVHLIKLASRNDPE